MSEVTFAFTPIKSRGRETLEVTHSIDKTESRLISKFQYLGYLLRQADASVAYNDFLGPSVVIQFGFDVNTLGYDEYAPVHILCAPDWKIRMYAAWCVIGGAERDLASNLNYDDIQNYWPNADFLAPDWADEVRNWAQYQSANEQLKERPIELEIAQWVGQPRRPAIEFAP
ncbi:hypothetical protein PSE10C_51180 [Pseudomonas amygdali pv. eriobotryae]|uniref:hypothetical protein n=1 Tax=Pseudomonas amygdali TaxID=47877 RepID=UPI00084F6381|nr:hypothetical protein [Pseudomonas amygdali]GFZ74376.1 hypothetical protein PSE10C_51180 [Pseudomonas amygdali pv. eriobotryae]